MRRAFPTLCVVLVACGLLSDSDSFHEPSLMVYDAPVGWGIR